MFRWVLIAVGISIFAVGALHGTLALEADRMLGAAVSEASVSDPTLDSQNRFLGVSFALFGAVFLLAAQDLQRYEPVFRAALAIFFLGGLARVASMALAGWPTPPVVGLTVIELLLPPILWIWASRLQGRA